MPGVKSTVLGALGGGALGGMSGLAYAYATGKDDVVPDLVKGAVSGAVTGAYAGFVGATSRPGDKLSNVASAVWHVAKAFSASMVSLGTILPMQACVTAAVVGLLTHANGGKPPTPEQMVLIKVAIDGLAFDAAARPGGILAGGVQALGAVIEQLSEKCKIQLRAPLAPVGAALAPDLGGLCFGILLGARAASSIQYTYAHDGKGPPISPSTAFDPSWMTLASAIAAGISVMGTIVLTSLMHRESKFGWVPPPRPLDLIISRSNAIGNYPGMSAHVVFGARAALGRKGIIEFGGGSGNALAATSALVVGPGIYVLSQKYLIDSQLHDRGAPGKGAAKPLLALRDMKSPSVQVPLKTLEARQGPAITKRATPQSQTGFTRLLMGALDVAKDTMLTLLCVGFALRAAEGDEDGNFLVSQSHLDSMAEPDALLQFAAGTLAFVFQAGATAALLKWGITRNDPEARRAVEGFVGGAIAALDRILQATGAPSFLVGTSIGAATGALASELYARFRNPDDPRKGYAPPDDKERPDHERVRDLIGKDVQLPGILERFASYFSLAWHGMPTPQPAIALAPGAMGPTLPPSLASTTTSATTTTHATTTASTPGATVTTGTTGVPGIGPEDYLIDEETEPLNRTRPDTKGAAKVASRSPLRSPESGTSVMEMTPAGLPGQTDTAEGLGD